MMGPRKKKSVLMVQFSGRGWGMKAEIESNGYVII